MMKRDKIDPNILVKQGGLSPDEAKAVMPTQAMFQDTPETTFFATDEFIQGSAFLDKDLKPMLPLFSHMMRTSNIKRKDAKKINLQIQGLMARQEALAYDDLFDISDSAKFEANELYIRMGVNDSIDGWRLRSLIEKIRTQRIQVMKEGGILDRFRRKKG